PKYGKEVELIFRKADVFLLPGTGGLAVNEAMAYALPVISAPGDGTIYDLIDDGKNGFLIEHNCNIDVLASRMEYFLNLKKEGLDQMGNYSLQKIQQEATLDNMANQFVKGILNFG